MHRTVQRNLFAGNTSTGAVNELAAPGVAVLEREAPSRRRDTDTLSCIDLFAGAGGLSLGLERAGFRSCLAVEVSPDCCQTYRRAFPRAAITAKPVEEIAFRAYEGVDLLAGGPPCQPFSSGGKRLAAADLRNMIPHFLRALQEIRPRAFLMENVPGLFSTTHAAYFLEVFTAMESLGYTVSAAILNAADFGVPQTRRRGFFVGLRRGVFVFPSPTHGPKAGRPYTAAGTVVSSVAVIGEPNQSKVFYAKQPEPRPSPYDGHLFNGGGRAVALGSPCRTILASAGGNKTHFIDALGLVPAYHAHLLRGGKPRFGCLEGGRRLTVEESALIQTFPSGMTFCGSRSSRYMQVGNAVPPRLAEALGRAIMASLS